MLKNLSIETGRLRSALLKLAITNVLLSMFAITASAYTLVFRNGNRMEIPSEFTLTRTTLTFEISPGFNKTLQVILIDVAATERANNEAPGSFFKRREQVSDASEPATPQATRTLTNSDLTAIRQRRIESERTYEARRKELGLPTVAETRWRQDRESEVLREQIRESSVAKSREESYWRKRARDLRTEIATVDTQINYLNARLSELRDSSPVTGSWTSTYPLWPDRPWSRNDRWGYPNGSRRRPRTTPPIFGPEQAPYGYPAGQYPYGYPSGQYPYGYPNGYPNAPYGNQGPGPYGYPSGQYPYGYPGQNPYGYPNAPYSNGYPSGPFDKFSSEPGDLRYRLDDLLLKRAGLAAEWQALENEAREARVPQIWLEP